MDVFLLSKHLQVLLLPLRLVHQQVNLHRPPLAPLHHLKFVLTIHHGDMLKIVKSIVVGSISIQVNIAQNPQQKVFLHLKHVLLLVAIFEQKLVTFQDVMMTLGSDGGQNVVESGRFVMIICISMLKGGAETLVSIR